MTRVLFVCLANICRSPMALAVAQGMSSGDKRFGSIFRPKSGPIFDAAGISAGARGEPMDARAKAALGRRGYPIVAKRSRRVVARDFVRFDMVLAMDGATLDSLRRICPSEHASKLALFLDFAAGHEGQDVPDPYFGDAQGFESVLNLCEVGARALLDKLEAAAKQPRSG